MAKPHHEIARAYLNKSTRSFSFDDIEGARRKFETMSKTQKGPRVKYVKDIIVSDESINVRVYRNSLEKLPVIVFFHGGGFVLGSIDSHDSVARFICKYTGCVVASVNYGLAPKYKYPVQNRQGQQVVNWLIKNGETQNIDTSKIFLAGDSAGGAILLEVAMAMGAIFSGLILVYPAVDPRLNTKSMQKYGRNHFLTKDMLVNFWDLYGVDKNTYWPPANSKLIALPPTLIITGEKDVLKDEGHDLADKLAVLNVPVTYKCYADMLHGFLQFPGVISKKKQAFAQINEFVHKYSE